MACLRIRNEFVAEVRVKPEKPDSQPSLFAPILRTVKGLSLQAPPPPPNTVFPWTWPGFVEYPHLICSFHFWASVKLQIS